MTRLRAHRDDIRLDSIMCVVDAEQIFAAPEIMELKLRQVAFADMLILNKVDLVSPAEIERIKAPGQHLRCKGVVHVAEEPGRRVILQVVGKRVDIAVGDEWNGTHPRTRIIAIGARDGVDGGSLREAFDKCRDAAASRPVLMA